MAPRRRNRGCGECCGEQPVLRGLILLVSIFMLCMGIGMIVFWMSNHLHLYQSEMTRAAVLLKLQSGKTNANMADMFDILGLAGYGTVNIGAVAVCAASGRRRVHSVAGAVGAGLGAFIYLSVLLNYFRPRIEGISRTLEEQLNRYFKAFQATGDAKYLNQIHLEKSCCGLQGATDFKNWGREVPSSCCGLFTGKCEIERAGIQSCQKAIKQLSGDDGLFNVGYIAQVLGISCIVLGLFLVLLIFFPGSDAIENMGKLGRRINAAERRAAREELKRDMKWGDQSSPSTRDRQESESFEEPDPSQGATETPGDAAMDKAAKTGAQGRVHALFNTLKTAVEGMTTSRAKRDGAQIHQLLEEDLRMRTGQGMSGSLNEKAAQKESMQLRRDVARIVQARSREQRNASVTQQDQQDVEKHDKAKAKQDRKEMKQNK